MGKGGTKKIGADHGHESMRALLLRPLMSVPSSRLLDLEFVAHVRGVVFSCMARRLHIGRGGGIIFCYPALLVAAEGVAAEVGVRGIELAFGLLGEFG